MHGKTDYAYYGLYYLVFSVIGWIYEVIVYAFEFGYGYVNRGFLFGPWLPVYGFGGIIIVFLLGNFKNKKIKIGKLVVTPIICFCIIVLVSTTTELIGSYLMEWVTGSWLWDYSMDYPNFQGRIALKSSLRFGLIGMGGLYVLKPYMEKLLDKCRAAIPKLYYATSFILEGLFAIDVLSRFFIGGNYVGP